MKGHKNDEESGVPVVWGEAERVGTVQPGEAKAWGDFTNVHLMSGSKGDGARLLPSVSNGRTRGNGCGVKQRKCFLFFFIFYWRGGQTQECCPVRLQNVHAWRYANPQWTQPWIAGSS